MNLVQRLILYLFPLYLTVMEQIIRTIFSAEAFSVSAISSSISVGGLALLLPYLVPSPFTEGLSPQVLQALAEKKVGVYRARDQYLATSAWISLVSLTFMWIYSLSKKAESTEFIIMGQTMVMPEFIAMFIYLVGIIHTELKRNA